MNVLVIFFIFTVPAVLCNSLPSGLESLLTKANFDPVADRPLYTSLISKTYDGNIRNGFKVLEFIERFPLQTQRIVGYRLLFDEMKANNDLYTTELMSLAWRVHLSFKDNSNNADLLHINQHLPKSVLNFPWMQPIRLQNARYKEFVYSPYDKFVKDGKNRFIFSWSKQDDCNDNTCKWAIKMKEGEKMSFYLMNVERNELLYAGPSDTAYDKDRRYVFGWREKELMNPGGDTWMFQPLESGTFKIFNMHYGEYLYCADNSFNADDSRRRLFTWRRLGCDNDQCEFYVTG